MLFASAFLSSDHEALHRVDKTSLSDQTLMELLVAEITDSGIFRDKTGSFREITRWKGVSVAFEEIVVGIEWGVDIAYGLFATEENLSALDPGGSIDLQWLPSKLKTLDISDMELFGSLETEVLPRNMEYLDISANEFVGSVIVECFPKTLRIITINRNKFSGSLRIECLPDNLCRFMANGNQFTGSLDFSNLPETLISIHLHGNHFSGSIDLSRLPPSLVTIMVDGNDIKQDVLVIGDLPQENTFIRVGRENFGKIVDLNGCRWDSVKVR